MTLIPQSACKHRVHCLFDPHHEAIAVALPPRTSEYGTQDSYEPSDSVALDTWGETKPAPLGYVVLGRSGDKASDANVGFFVRQDDEYEWLRSMLTIAKLKELLGPEEYSGARVDRFEMRNIRVVHFLLKNHLDRGYNSGSKLDTLAKNLCEYLRAKVVDIPTKFLERGRI